MQKVFALLLAEFRKLGATIVFANFSKIIIDTGKYDLSAAKAYSDSLLRTIQSRSVLPKPKKVTFLFYYIKVLVIFGIIEPKDNKSWKILSVTSFKNEKYTTFN